MPLGITVAFCLALLVDSFKGVWANLFRAAYFLPVVLPAFLAATIAALPAEREDDLCVHALDGLTLPFHLP